MPAPSPIGLDIGATSIRAVETSKGKDGPVITNYGRIPLPKGVVQSGVIHEEETVTAALKQLWTSANFGTRQTVIGVTNPQVVVREITVNNLPDRELRRSLPFQVRDTLPLPVERSVLDFHKLEDPGSNDIVRGLLIAAPKDTVLTAIRAIEAADLHVDKVDLASFAVLRAVSRVDGEVEALVDIGAQSTTVIVHSDGVPIIVRTIPRGGQEITDIMASRLNIDPAEAEELKAKVGLNSEEDEDTASIVREAVRPLMNEIRSSFAYLTSGERQTRVARLALSGGGAMLPGLVESLKDQLNILVVIADPTARLYNPRGGKRRALGRSRSSATVAIGLTLGN